MSPAPRKRSTVLVAVGVAVFLLGTAGAVLATRDSGGASAAPNTTTTTAVPAGAVIVGVPAPPANFVIPSGQQAIAVQIPYVPGVAGYAKADDFVNVYGAFGGLPPTADPGAKLILQKVKVLSVTQPAPGVEAGNATYMLAVDTAQAETIVYLASFQKVYLTLAHDDQPAQASKGFQAKNA